VNSGETAVEFVTPGGAGSSISIVDLLNSQKASSDTPDDNFTGGSLDGKWTAVSGSSGTIDFEEGGASVAKYEVDTANDLLLMQVGHGGTEVVELRQDFTLGDGDCMVVAISPGLGIDASTGPVANSINVGIALNDTDTGYNDGNYVQLYLDTDTGDYLYKLYDGASILASFPGEHDPHTMFLRVNRNGLVYTFFLSLDGMSWTYFGSDTAGSAYDNFWIWANCLSSGLTVPVPVQTFHWVRQGTQDLFPWSPLVTIPTTGGAINFGTLETLTIATGVVTRTSTSSFFNIAAESGSSDDLDTINGGSDGDVIVLRPDTGDTITVRDNIGNIQLVGNFVMDNEADKLTLIFDSGISKWCEIASSGNA
jgi:hypothetical protein